MPARRTTILDHFSTLPDPRIERTKRHRLVDILAIALCAVICGAEAFTEMEDFGEARLEWFEQWLELPHGIPSHDTFARVFSRLDPAAFSRCFARWTQALREATQGEVIAIDGKTLCGSFDTATGNAAIHMVSAWATTNSLVLGQVKVAEKSNEITAIPRLLEMLDLAGCTITIDAMGTQKAIAHQIRKKEADYVLTLKDNQPNLRADVQAYLERSLDEQFRDHQDTPLPHTRFQSRDNDHGRLETRTCWALECPSWVEGYEQWAGLKAIALIQSERAIGDRTSIERRFYLTSLPPDARKIAHAVRSHWGIENSLHWLLDVAFDEDHCRIRKDNAPANMATLRHIAINMLKSEKTIKRSINRKRLLAAWEQSYLQRILFRTPDPI